MSSSYETNKHLQELFLLTRHQDCFIDSIVTKDMGGVLTCLRFTNMPVVNDGKTTMGYMFQFILSRPEAESNILHCNEEVTATLLRYFVPLVRYIKRSASRDCFCIGTQIKWLIPWSNPS
jgi:hypothetical protein